MVLTELELENFKRFRQRTISFNPGLNVVKGPNEAGKTTVRTALTVALFENPLSSKEGLKRYQSWHNPALFRLVLNYLDQDGLPCRLEKNFEEKKMFLECNGEHFRIPKSIQRKLHDTIGLDTMEFFNLMSSLDIRSLDNLGSSASRKQVARMIAGLMSGTESGQDVLAAIRKLDEALRDLQKGLKGQAKIPGPLKAARDQKSSLQTACYEQKQALALKSKHLHERLALETERKEAEHQRETLLQLVGVNQRLAKLRQRQEELTAQEQEYEQRSRQRRELEQAYDDLSRRVAGEPLLKLSGVQLDRLLETQARLRTLEESLQATLPSPPQRSIPARSGLIAAALAGVALLFWNWPIGLMVTGVSGWLLIRKEQQHRHQHRRYQEVLEKQTALKSEKETLEAFIREWDRQMGLAGQPDLRERWQAAQNLKIKQETLQEQLSKTPAVDEKRWENVRRELRLTRDELHDPGLAGLVLEPEKLMDQKHRLARLETESAQLHDRITHLDALLNHDSAHQEKLVEMEEHLERLNNRIAYLEQREKVCQLTLAYLDKARQASMNPARLVLEKRAGQLLSLFTEGQYEQIAIDDKDLSSLVLVKETDRWETPEVLSQGTFDQFYLSLRLAMSEILTEGRKPPLLLDEPLSAFDEQRFQAAVQTLKKIAQERQIVVFSCRDDYDAMADHVITLD